MEIRYKLTDDQRKLFDAQGTMIELSGSTFYFLPFWVEMREGEERAVIHHLGNLPSNLMAEIEKIRDFQPNGHDSALRTGKANGH